MQELSFFATSDDLRLTIETLLEIPNAKAFWHGPHKQKKLLAKYRVVKAKLGPIPDHGRLCFYGEPIPNDQIELGKSGEHWYIKAFYDFAATLTWYRSSEIHRPRKISVLKRTSLCGLDRSAGLRYFSEQAAHSSKPLTFIEVARKALRRSLSKQLNEAPYFLPEAARGFGDGKIAVSHFRKWHTRDKVFEPTE